MEYQQMCLDDSRNYSSQGSEYVYDSLDDYSHSSDSYDGSSIDDSELEDDAYCFDDQENIYTKYFYKIYKTF